jgi:hypothetical protein
MRPGEGDHETDARYGDAVPGQSRLYQQALGHLVVLRAALLSPKACWISKCALILGIAYLFVPIDLIPASTYGPIVGHFDEASFLLGGFVLARVLVPTTFLEERLGLKLRQLLRGPNFFIVGAPKAGTTSLFEALAHHEDVFCCPVKEPSYFALDLAVQQEPAGIAGRERPLIRGRPTSLLEPPRVGLTTDYDAYLDLFHDWKGQRAIGEASTDYLSSVVAARQIATAAPEARIIIILRDPVARSYADYLMQKQIGHDPGSFEQAVAAELKRLSKGAGEVRGIVASSLYAPQIRRYLEHFPRQQILFLLFDELIAEPQRTLEIVFRHLSVDPAVAATITLGRENQSRVPRFDRLNRVLLASGRKSTLLRAVPRPIRHRLRPLYYVRGRPPPLSPTVADSLRALFHDDILETAALTGRDLSRWLKRR